MVKVAGLKTWNSIKKRFKHRYFLVNFTHFFPKTSFTEHFWTTVSADSSVPNKVLFFRLFHRVFPFIIDIVGEGVAVPPLFKAPTSWPSLSPFLKFLFALLSFLLHTLLRCFRQFPPPSQKPSCPNLTNQPSLV